MALGAFWSPDCGRTPAFEHGRRSPQLQTATPRSLPGFFNRPRVHFMRNVLAHAGRQGRRVVSAIIATPFDRTMPQQPASSGASSPTRSARKCPSWPG